MFKKEFGNPPVVPKAIPVSTGDTSSSKSTFSMILLRGSCQFKFLACHVQWWCVSSDCV